MGSDPNVVLTDYPAQLSDVGFNHHRILAANASADLHQFPDIGTKIFDAEFTCSVCFRVDIADFLQLQTTFSCFPFMGEVPLQGSETLALYPQSDKVHIHHMLLVC